MLIVNAESERFTNKQPQNYNVKQTEASMTAPQSHSLESSSQRGVCTGVLDKKYDGVHTDSCRRALQKTETRQRQDAQRKLEERRWGRGRHRERSEGGVQRDYEIVVEQGTKTKGRLEK